APVVLAAVDPAQPYGAALPWPARGADDSRRPARVAGAYVVLAGGEPILYLERGGRAMQTLVRSGDPRVEAARHALGGQVRVGRGSCSGRPGTRWWSSTGRCSS